MPDEAEINDLVRTGCLAADSVVIGLRNATPAEETRVAIDAAIRALLDNGLISVTPSAQWPQWIEIDRWRAAADLPVPALPEETPQ